MPWKESSVMDERMRFVIRFKDGESMASLCREFGISRKTGYKIFERYEECGLEGLSDRTRRPFRYANQLPEQVEAAIIAAKREKPNWGARKIRERLVRRLPHAVKVPAASTVHAVLDRHGLVSRPVRSRTRAERHAFVGRTESQRSMVHGLQGRVHAGRQALLLSADRHRSRFALFAVV